MKSLYKKNNDMKPFYLDSFEIFLYEDDQDENLDNEECIDETSEYEDTIIEEKCQNIIKEAENKAQNIIKKANEDSEKIKKEIYDEAYRLASRKAEEDSVKKFNIIEQKKIEELQQEKDKIIEIAENMKASKKDIIEKYIDDMKDLSIAISEKIIGDKISYDPAIVKKMILNEVEKKNKNQWIKIHLDKSSYDYLMNDDDDLVDELKKHSENIRIVESENHKPGFCILETDDELMDISVSTQISNIRDLLNGSEAVNV